MQNDDLISRSGLGVDFCNPDVFENKAYAEGWNSLIKIIKEAPSVDAAPVRHGRWAHLGGDEWCCTQCGDVIHTEGSWEKPTKKYCNECGAKMDAEGNNNA